MLLSTSQRASKSRISEAALRIISEQQKSEKSSWKEKQHQLFSFPFPHLLSRLNEGTSKSFLLLLNMFSIWDKWTCCLLLGKWNYKKKISANFNERWLFWGFREKNFSLFCVLSEPLLGFVLLFLFPCSKENTLKIWKFIKRTMFQKFMDKITRIWSFHFLRGTFKLV